MKLGQFVCLGHLQRLKNRFSHGYSVQVKVPLTGINHFKEELLRSLPGVEIEGKTFFHFPLISSWINIIRTTQWHAVLQRAHPFDGRSSTEWILRSIAGIRVLQHQAESK